MRGTGIVEVVAYQAALSAARVAANPFHLPSAPPMRVDALPLPWKSELSERGVRNWLSQSPDYATLLDLACFGADLRYRRPVSQWPQGSFPNLVADEHAPEIERQILAEARQGWLVPVPLEVQARFGCCNAPIIAADEGCKIRRITDLSNKRNSVLRGVNAMVDIDSLGDAPMHRCLDLAAEVHRLRALHPNLVLGIVVRDLSKAFRRLSVRLDQVPSLVTRWKGQVYWDLRLPFGHKASAHYCCKLSTAIAQAVEAHFSAEVACLAYVDDFVLVAPPHLQAQALFAFNQIICDLGLTISASKAETSGSWGPHADWIGFTHNVRTMTHGLPQQKLQTYTADVCAMTCEASKARAVPHSNLLRLVGRINHVATVFTAGRAFMRNLLAAVGHKQSRVRLNGSHLADLAWWHSAMLVLPRFAHMRRGPRPSDPLIASDASLFGFGAALDMTGSTRALSAPTPDSEWLAGRFSEPSQSGDMTLLEAWATLAALHHWAHQLNGRTVRVHVDNVSLEFALKKGRSLAPVSTVWSDKLCSSASNTTFAFTPFVCSPPTTLWQTASAACHTHNSTREEQRVEHRST